MLEGLSRMQVASEGDTGRSVLAQRLSQAITRYESLSDYRAMFYKTEGAGPREKILLKFEKPFKIFMGWLNTKKKGLQVLYERGKHKNKLAVHTPGFLSHLAPVLFLDQSSPWVREGSESFDIEDAGIGTFLYEFTKAVLRGQREQKLSVESDGDALDVSFPGSQKNEDYFAYRVRVKFDPLSGLPVSMALFDWQDRPVGIYEYEELSLNVGREDAVFKRQIDRRMMSVYTGS